MRCFVKVCGVRTLEDALGCGQAGVDLIGFNFWPGSKRFVSVEVAARIADRLPPGLRTVGVFVNPSEADVQRAFASGAVDLVQLHGDESPEFCRRFAGRFWKALRLTDEGSLALLDDYTSEVILVDAEAPGWGGSGRRAPVELAQKAAARRRVMLAGGLTPENVAEAVRAVQPWGVDVASGVERAPGVKDPGKVMAFVKAVRGTE
jgi:phosphoribosylanthranilate isomerase